MELTELQEFRVNQVHKAQPVLRVQPELMEPTVQQALKVQ
jgi:hypothetical protein